MNGETDTWYPACIVSGRGARDRGALGGPRRRSGLCRGWRGWGWRGGDLPRGTAVTSTWLTPMYSTARLCAGAEQRWDTFDWCLRVVPLPNLSPNPGETDTYQPSLRFNERSVLTIHFVVEPAGVTQVMPGAVSSPERGSSCSTVHTLSAF